MSEELPPSERPPEPPQPPRYSWEDEKAQEKEAEKEAEKMAEKGEGYYEAEKGRMYAEKYQRDPLSGAIWAGIFILAGLILLADNMGYLPKIGSAGALNWIALGAGCLLLLEVIVRVVSPDYARPIVGRIIFAGILMFAGLSGLVNIESAWPLILVVIGVAVLANAILRRR
jgi:hypothetical protein